MKKNIFNYTWVLLLTYLGIAQLQAQSANCNTATPFCSNTLDPFPATTGQPNAPVGNNYDCLGSEPNPAWFTMTIGASGNIDFTLDNTNNEDIDFIVWGPFANTAAANAACGGLGNGGASGNVIDCSYSGNAQEPVSIPNAQAGEVYILLVTNYSNQPTDIFSTTNTGTGTIVCDCHISAEYMLTPIPNNTGVMTDTSNYEADFVVCAPATPSGTPGELYFTVRLVADSIGDSLAVYVPGTTIANSFQAGNFAVFGNVYYGTNQYDTMEITVFINAPYDEIGVHNFELSVINYSASGSTCVQSLPITVVIPGVDINAPDTVLCPAIGHDIVINSAPVTQGGTGTATFVWTQTAGATATITNPSVQNTTIHIPSATASGDAFSFAVQYTDPNGCVSSDTVNFLMQTHPINVDLVGDRDYLCNGSVPQAVQFTTTTDSTNIIASNGTFTWNNTATLNNSTIGNPIATLTGNNAADSIQYIVRFDYGTCSGADTVMIHFRDAVISVNATPDTICAGQTAQLAATLSDTFIVSTPNCTDYDGTAIPYAPIAGTGTAVTNFVSPFGGFPDLDGGSTPTPMPIGFPFTFYCKTYTDFYLDVNGILGFTPFINVNHFPNPLPTNFDDNNMIPFAWTDIDLGGGGSYEYFTTGTAPNRKLVVNLINGARFLETDSTITTQLILYETTNVIEIHTTLLTQSTFGATTSQGVEDSTGTHGETIPGRDQADIHLQNDAYRFTPSIIYLSSAPTYAWTPTASLSSGSIYNPVANPTASTVYNVTITDVGCPYSGAVTVTVQPSLLAPTVSCDTSTLNSVTFSWTAVAGAASYEYSINGSTWTSTSNLTATITGLAQGTTINLQVRAINNANVCPIGLVGIGTCSTQSCALTASIMPMNGIPCSGAAVASLMAMSAGGTSTDTYLWSNGATTDIPTNLAAGTYTVTITNGTCVATANYTILAPVTPFLDAWIDTLGITMASTYVNVPIDASAGANQANVTYLWTGGAGITTPNNNTTTIMPTDTGTFEYIVQATLDTCSSQDTVYLTVLPAGFAGMPTAFSPNGDGQNDLFRPVQLQGGTVLDFRVFNRWGDLVYVASGDLTNVGWDGTLQGTQQPRDVYVYLFEYKLPTDTKPKQLRGEFLLVR